MAESVFTVEQAIEGQARSCTSIGSPLYGALLDGLLDDYRNGGLTADLLDEVSAKPLHDALPLRYLAAGHLLALEGNAPNLARHFPSCGGEWDGSARVVTDFLACVADNRAAVHRGMRRNVQTNEVGRAPVLASGFALIGQRHGLPLDMLEIGSSAGLLSRWDRFRYDTGSSGFGDEASTVRFGPEWWESPAPTFSVSPVVRSRRGSDISPIDVSAPEGRMRALSFVWPDQVERISRLRAALDIAASLPVRIDPMDAGDWLGLRLEDGPRPGAATVVFHSIVWQYLPATTKYAVRSALTTAGLSAGPDNPLLWLRMEPANAANADLRLTTWPGGAEEHVADVGYHGAGVRWRLDG